MNEVAPILKNPFDELEFTAGNQKKSACHLVRFQLDRDGSLR